MRSGGFDRPGVKALVELRHRPIGVEFNFFPGGHAIPDSLEKQATLLEGQTRRIYLC